MTNDKTVTMSRELAESLLKSIEDAALCGYPSPCEAQELRALLAATAVEPAKCGICGQGAWACNEGGCHYLESGNGAPVVERQPVAEVVSKFGDPEAFGEREIAVLADLSKIPYDTKLYTSPPAPVAVVLPERKTENLHEPHSMEWFSQDDTNNEWNACLDKVKELNK